MEIKDLLENYNNYLAEIKTKEYIIKKLELEEVSISSSNFAVNGDIKPKRIYEFKYRRKNNKECR